MSLPADLPLPRQLEKASYHWMTWGHFAAPGHTLEMVTDDEYWVHALHANPGIRQYDTIRVVAQDGSYCADIMFVEIDERRLWARCRVLQQYWGAEDIEAGKDTLKSNKDPDGWLVEWGGPVHKWRIVSPAGAVADKGISSREEANQRLLLMKPPRAA